VAHVVRYFAGYAAARASIAQGDIGPVRELRLRRTGAAPTAAWFHDEAASGGVLMDQMIHDFDYSRWVLGEVDTVTASTEERVDADGNRLVRASATLVHVGGATSTLAGGWLSPAEPFTTCLTVIGDVGGIRHTNAADVLEVTREGSVVRVDLDDDRPYDGELLDLISAIATGATPRVTAADALAAVDLTLAARESAATGRPVTPWR
jgi:myo-inositol 2-dehydrogenase/D-chiro-inositol 1-dehydrogenase